MSELTNQNVYLNLLDNLFAVNISKVKGWGLLWIMAFSSSLYASPDLKWEETTAV